MPANSNADKFLRKFVLRRRTAKCENVSLKLPKIDLDELRKLKEENFKERLKFV
jgi:hypothetical protein